MSAALRYQFGEIGVERIEKAKVLVIGAGGIGCEILKNLALSGYRHVTLVDLDTIDVSNLNRQFLFRPEHVGQPKAIIAAEAARHFNPKLQVIPYHENIKSSRYSVSFFATFDVILNALDNLDARRHVNRLCLAANVPLFDSGTTGYLGQVVPILPLYTACYECFPKLTPKVYPICTIRSTPDKPVHCIVWAKEALKLIFGITNESMLYEDEDALEEKSAYMSTLVLPESLSQRLLTAKSQNESVKWDIEEYISLVKYGAKIAEALYTDEVEKRISMDTYKTAKITPVPIDRELIQSVASQLIAELTSAGVDELENVTLRGALPEDASSIAWEQREWSLEQNIQEFLRAFLAADLTLLGSLSFDKDDEWSMRFVAAAGNLRASIFSIPQQSFHAAKGIAGNIIPAIATTNAIVAANQVLQATLLLVHTPKEMLYREGVSIDDRRAEMAPLLKKYFAHTYCQRFPTSKGLYLQPSSVDEPQAICYVCSKAPMVLKIDTNTRTFGEVVSNVLKTRLGFNEPTITCGSSILYEEGEDCDEDLAENLPLILSKCPAGGIVDSSMLSVEDFTQNLEVSIIVQHMNEEDLPENAVADGFLLLGELAMRKENESAGDDSLEGAEEDDDFMIEEDNVSPAVENDDMEVVEVLDSSSTTEDAMGKRCCEEPAFLPESKRPNSGIE